MSVRLLQGDVRAMLRTLPDKSVHMVCTSPPYFGLRAYGTEPQIWGGAEDCEHEWAESLARVTVGNNSMVRPKGETETPFVATAYKAAADGHQRSIPAGVFCLRCGAWRGELGQEPTPDLFVDHLVEIFREVKRVLRDDGTLWLNIGDSYAGSGKGPTGHNGIGDQERRQGFGGGPNSSFYRSKAPAGRNRIPGHKPKDLLLMPYRLALALQADGWWIRSQIAWCKRSVMPESVMDRPTAAWEPIFLLSKQGTYYYDAEAVRQSYAITSIGRYAYPLQDTPPGSRQPGGDFGRKVRGLGIKKPNPTGANLRNFWLLGPEPSREDHYASYPTEIPRRAILAGTSHRGVCPECRAPWRRVVKREKPPDFGRGTQSWNAGASAGIAGPQRNNSGGLHPISPRTAGWAPTCRHADREPVPATVLDPFLGSGTTALVADRLGRDCIGIELSETYAAMARRRLVNDAPLLAGVPYEPVRPIKDKQDRLADGHATGAAARRIPGFNARRKAAEADRKRAADVAPDEPVPDSAGTPHATLPLFGEVV